MWVTIVYRIVVKINLPEFVSTNKRMISERLKELIDKKGISKSELARITGVSRVMVYKWCDDGIEPKRENLRKLAAALNVSVEYLLHGKRTPVASSGTDVFKLKKAIEIVRRVERLREQFFEPSEFAEKTAELYYRLVNGLPLKDAVPVDMRDSEELKESVLNAFNSFIRVAIRHGDKLTADEREELFVDILNESLVESVLRFD